jgi:hypothetical protein
MTAVHERVKTKGSVFVSGTATARIVACRVLELAALPSGIRQNFAAQRLADSIYRGHPQAGVIDFAGRARQIASLLRK